MKSSGPRHRPEQIGTRCAFRYFVGQRALQRPEAARVLIVDNEISAARMLARMLREDGYAVEVAVDGAAAIARLTADPLPDVLVTDVNMPHVDGATVARYARSRNKDIPILFVTGYPHLLTSLVLDPCAAIHTKPVDYAKLRQQIAAALVGDGAHARDAEPA